MTRYQNQWEVRSSSNPNRFYTVSLTLDNQYQCSCPGWIYRHTDCKHIRSIRGTTRLSVVHSIFAEANSGGSIWDDLDAVIHRERR